MTYITIDRKLDFPLQDLLDRLNIDNLPIPNSVLTSVGRADALNYLKGLVHSDTIRFISRLLSAQFSKAVQKREGDRWKDGWLSVPRNFIRKAYHRDSWSEIPILIELGILEHNGYSTNGRCKGYRVIWNKLVDVFSLPITKDTPKTFLELPSSKRRLDISEIARDAEKAIPVGKMNLLAVIRYFTVKMNLDNEISSLVNDANYVFICYLNRTNYDDETGILTYKQHYHTSEIGGRIYASSGDQLISRELKVHWFNISSSFNYDIKGAHIALFNQIYQTQFATNWVNNIDGFRQKLADKVEIPISLMKRSVLALTYGALPTAYHKCEIYQLFLAHFGDKSSAVERLERFKLVTSEYRSALSNWFKSIGRNIKKYQTNALGLKTDTTDVKSLASHYLQGKEQEAIIWITSKFNQTRYRYEVISNQFDGLVTVAKIPDRVLAAFQDKFKLTIEIKAIG